MRYLMCEIETSRIPEALSLSPGYDGAGVVLRNAGASVGFALCPSGRNGSVSTIGLRERPWHVNAAPIRAKSDTTTLTIAICTRGRPVELGRCLERLISLQREDLEFDVLVVDNAPTDDRNLSVVSSYPTIRYLVERTPGLSVARNAAIRAATGDVIAFTDDDVVPDRSWIIACAPRFRKIREPQLLAARYFLWNWKPSRKSSLRDEAALATASRRPFLHPP